MAGYPNMTVPMGFVFGLPVGLSIVPRRFVYRLRRGRGSGRPQRPGGPCRGIPSTAGATTRGPALRAQLRWSGPRGADHWRPVCRGRVRLRAGQRGRVFTGCGLQWRARRHRGQLRVAACAAEGRQHRVRPQPICLTRRPSRIDHLSRCEVRPRRFVLERQAPSGAERRVSSVAWSGSPAICWISDVSSGAVRATTRARWGRARCHLTSASTSACGSIGTWKPPRVMDSSACSGHSPTSSGGRTC